MEKENIRKNWKIDKETFKEKELGGLQDFVCDVLQCEEIFGLRKGNESTKIQNRKYEFTRETRKKDEKGRADFVIFIDKNEIVIPVEVEKYEKIISGEKQLFRYQLEWQKKYGILTDGGTWRFYNNNIYREFSIDEILDNTEKFLIFWHDYIKPENYYLSFFEISNSITSNSEKNENGYSKEIIKVEENLNLFFDDTTQLINSFVDKLDLAGFFKNTVQKENKKKAIEISFAYLIQFVLYKTLVDNLFSDFEKEYNNRIDSIKNSITVGVYSTVLVQISSISNFISDKLYKPFSSEQEHINDKLNSFLQKPKNNLDDVSLWLDIIVYINKFNFANIKNEIFGFVYENYLKALYDDSKFGQYFTSPDIVNLMLDEIGYTKDEIKKRFLEDGEKAKISIIDPSCGSGTFLYSAVDRIIDALDDYTPERAKIIENLISENIYGLDIAEFPLYLAEMNILMRLLPLIINEKYNNPIEKKIQVFLTKDSISEFLDAGIYAIDPSQSQNSEQENLFDSSQLALGYKSFIRDEDELYVMKDSLRPPRRRFDFVVGNPPYVDYNTCAKQKTLFTELIKQKQISMGDIYGVNLHTVPERNKPYAPKPNLFSFFTALGFALLKEDAKISFIIPQTLLTANDLDVMRFFLAKYSTIEKINIFDIEMFVERGLKRKRTVPTSSLIFLVKRRKPQKNSKISIKNFEEKLVANLKKNLRSSKSKNKKIEQTELLNKVENWNFIKHNYTVCNFIDKYNESFSVEEYRRNFENYDHIMFDGSINIKNKLVENIKSENCYLIPKLEKNKIKINHFRYISKKTDIKKAQGSQDHNELIGRNFKILWRYQNPNGFYFCDKKDVLPNFGIYCIASNDKKEILFLLSLLRTNISDFILKSLLKIEQEKSFLLGLKAIKNFIRVPRITDKNQKIKDEIVNQTEKMLNLGDVLMKDILDFSNISIQKFSDVKIENKTLFLSTVNETVSLKIPANKTVMIENAIQDEYFAKGVLSKEIILNDLKNLTVIDFEEQEKIKQYIDNLIFALYFDIEIQNIGIESTVEIENICRQNEFYSLLNYEFEEEDF